jgi:hypothetical protein
MFLVQILLPIKDNDGQSLPVDLYDGVVKTLTETFGGVTAYTRSAAEGRWHEVGAHTHADDIIVIEVMARTIDRSWWQDYRTALEKAFRQKQVIVRAHRIQLI